MVLVGIVGIVIVMVDGQGVAIVALGYCCVVGIVVVLVSLVLLCC